MLKKTAMHMDFDIEKNEREVPDIYFLSKSHSYTILTLLIYTGLYNCVSYGR